MADLTRYVALGAVGIAALGLLVDLIRHRGDHGAR